MRSDSKIAKVTDTDCDMGSSPVAKDALISGLDHNPGIKPYDNILQPDIKSTGQMKLSSPVCYADSREVRKEFRDV